VWFDGEEARGAWTATDSLTATGCRRVAELLDDARDAAARHDRPAVRALAESVLALDPENEDAAARLGYGRHFRRELMPVEDDHVPFMKQGVPAALLIDFNYPPWHTAEDTVDKVSAQSLTVVGEVLVESLPSVELHLSS
jgi:hypothetical protein